MTNSNRLRAIGFALIGPMFVIVALVYQQVFWTERVFSREYELFTVEAYYRDASYIIGVPNQAFYVLPKVEALGDERIIYFTQDMWSDSFHVELIDSAIVEISAFRNGKQVISTICVYDLLSNEPNCSYYLGG